MIDLYELRVHSAMGCNIKWILRISQNFQYQIYDHIYGSNRYRSIGESLQRKTRIRRKNEIVDGERGEAAPQKSSADRER